MANSSSFTQNSFSILLNQSEKRAFRKEEKKLDQFLSSHDKSTLSTMSLPFMRPKSLCYISSVSAKPQATAQKSETSEMDHNGKKITLLVKNKKDDLDSLFDELKESATSVSKATKKVVNSNSSKKTKKFKPSIHLQIDTYQILRLKEDLANKTSYLTYLEAKIADLKALNSTSSEVESQLSRYVANHAKIAERISHINRKLQASMDSE